MSNTNVSLSILSAGLLAVGLGVAGYFIGSGFVDAKALERSVVVKGLSEREVAADIAIWPLRFTAADNDLQNLVKHIEAQSDLVTAYLTGHGFAPEEITRNPPAITDKQAQSYGNNNARFRYLAQATITVYSAKIDNVRKAGGGLLELGKQGVVFSQDNYELRPQFVFQGLNDIKPAMVEEATRQARAVAQRFADDSNSRLGKIKRARQGQFSISNRDSNNPHLKRVRVVSTLEYFLAD